MTESTGTTLPVPSLRELRADLEQAKQIYGRRSSQALAAFQRLMTWSYEIGEPLDGLRQHTGDEIERFFAFTIHGPDGHVYWIGPNVFKRNDRSTRLPIRWWWEHRNGEIAQKDSVVSFCGERTCINPEHALFLDASASRRRYTDEAMIGALQVYALRIGKTPTTDEWQQARLAPSMGSYVNRFGSWRNAIRAAGLPPTAIGGQNKASPEKMIEVLQVLRTYLNRWPSTTDFNRPDVRRFLDSRGLPKARMNVYNHLGSWAEALRKAGKRDG